MNAIIAVGLGCAAGAMLRYGITMLSSMLEKTSITVTAIVNTVGSLAAGFIASRFDPSTIQFLIAIGLCGGYTTFSAFSIFGIRLIQKKKYLQSVLYIFGMLIYCFLTAGAGYWIGQAL